MSESFVFYKSFLDAISVLPDDKDRLAAYEAIIRYGIDGAEETPDSPIANAIFIMAKPQIEANEKRRLDGTRGGRPRKETEAEETEKPLVSYKEETEKPMVSENEENKKPMVSENEENKKPMVSDLTQTEKPNVNVNVNVNDNVNVNENENENENEKEEGAAPRSSSSPPLLIDVDKFITSRGYKVDARKFFDHYSSRGWKDKKGRAVTADNFMDKIAEWDSYNKDSPSNRSPDPVDRKISVKMIGPAKAHG